MSNISFSKMHGLGNDFIVIDGISQSIDMNRFPITELADRNKGIGFDQLLLIEKGEPFSCRIFNSDGSEAEQCGNGIRCVARFIHEKKLSASSTFAIQTKAGLIQAVIEDYDHIQINMGKPSFEPESITLEIENETVQVNTVSMGNPHAILSVPSLENMSVATLGKQIATHAFFPRGANVGFMQILDRDQIRLKTWERGVGETLACGSNACAAVVAGIINKLLNHSVQVELAYGNLFIEWKEKDSSVFMTGPAAHVFDGVIKYL